MDSIFEATYGQDIRRQSRRHRQNSISLQQDQTLPYPRASSVSSVSSTASSTPDLDADSQATWTTLPMDPYQTIGLPIFLCEDSDPIARTQQERPIATQPPQGLGVEIPTLPSSQSSQTHTYPAQGPSQASYIAVTEDRSRLGLILDSTLGSLRRLVYESPEETEVRLREEMRTRERRQSLSAFRDRNGAVEGWLD